MSATPSVMREMRGFHHAASSIAGHQQAELALVRRVGPALAGDAAAAHHQDAVGQREDLVELDRDQQDRLAGVAQRDEAAVDELDRADVDAARRLADEQHLRVALDLARQHDLLLVAAGEFGGLQPRRRRADVVALHLARRGRATIAAMIEERAVAEGAGRRDSRGSRSRRPRKDGTSPHAQPVLRHVQQPEPPQLMRIAAPAGRAAARRAGSCRAPDGACRRAPRAARSGRCRRRRRCRRSRRRATVEATTFATRSTPRCIVDRQVLDLEHGGARLRAAPSRPAAARGGRPSARRAPPAMVSAVVERRHHLAAAHHRDAVGDGHDLAQLVGDEDDGLALVLAAAARMRNSWSASGGVSTPVGSSRIRISAPR